MRHTASLADDALPPQRLTEVAEHVLRGEPFCFRAGREEDASRCPWRALSEPRLCSCLVCVCARALSTCLPAHGAYLAVAAMLGESVNKLWPC